MKREGRERECEVCFVGAVELHAYQAMIQCGSCGASAHRYCYLPTCDGAFTCDACQANFKGNCAICDNPGLLKRFDRAFAHPVCLLLSHAHLTNSANLVFKFRDLSFMTGESGKQTKRGQCEACGKTNGAVVRCSLGCSRASHVYCAMRGRVPSEGKGWSVSLPSGTSCGFSDLLEHVVQRRLVSHNDFLRKKLSLTKQGRREKVLIYCEEHSVTLVECRCRTFTEQKQDWIFCDGCCRWLHLACVDDLPKAELAIQNADTYVCAQCLAWKKAMRHDPLVLPEELPKLHIYDFIFLHLYLEERNFEVSPHLLDFALRLPVLPGRAYIETHYRMEVAKALRASIDLSELRRLLQSCDGENAAAKLGKVCGKAKERLFYIWWLCEGEMLGEKMKREVPFLKQQDEIDPDTVGRLLALILKFIHKFQVGKPEPFLNLRARLAPEPKDKAIEQEERSRGPPKMGQTLKYFRQQVKALLVRLQSQQGKENSKKVLLDLHALLHSKEITPFHEELPDIPIIQACLLFKKKQVALRYLTALANIDVLKHAWRSIITENPANPTAKNKIIAVANNFVQRCIYDEKDEALKGQILREWGKEEIMKEVPSSSFYLSEPEFIFPTITLHNLSLRRVTDVLTRFQENHKTKKGEQLQEFALMHKFLEGLRELPFTEESAAGLENLTFQKWEGPLTKLFPQIAQQFSNLYHSTESLLSEHGETQEGVCVFSAWQEVKQVEQRHIERYVNYFQEVKELKLSLFAQVASDTIKAKLIKLIECMEGCTPVFQTEAQFKLLTWWCGRFSVAPIKAGPIMQKDRAFQQGLALLQPNFDSLEFLPRLDSFLNEYLKYFYEFGLEFRVKQIKTILSWIDLFNYILQKIPPALLLSKAQLSRLETVQTLPQPDFFTIREAYTIMKQLRFPDCEFLRKLERLMAEGEKTEALIERVFSHCDWGFEITQDMKEKLSLQEFEEIVAAVKKSLFSFKAESIELEIIKEKFTNIEMHAQMLKLQFEQSPENSHIQRDALRLLISFGSFPISSHYPQFLWNIYERPRARGLPDNLEAYILELTKTHQVYSWQTLEFLQQEIEQKLESRHFKKDFIAQLAAMMTPGKQFAEKYAAVLLKFTQGQALGEQGLREMEALLSEERLLQFGDETAIELRMQYGVYQYVKAQMSNHLSTRAYSSTRLAYIEARLAQLHTSFSSPEIDSYRLRLQKLREREKEQSNPTKERESSENDVSSHRGASFDGSFGVKGQKENGTYERPCNFKRLQ